MSVAAHSSMRKCLRAIGIVLLLAVPLFAPSTRAGAAPVLGMDEVLGHVRGWAIGLSGGMGGCIATATYEDRTTVWMGFGGAGNKAFFALSNPKWKALTVGNRYELDILARGEGRWHGKFTALELETGKGLLATDLVTGFVIDIARAGALDVVYDRKIIAKLSLSGSMAAIDALLECQKEVVVALRKGSGGGSNTRERSSGSEPRKERASSGTGFFVSDQGYVLTNNHVVDGCRNVTVTQVGDAPVPVQVVARDASNDLALLKSSLVPKAIPALAARVRVGDSIFVYGFPLTGLLATNGNFTVGNVTAPAGLHDDTRMVQISAPVQPGNSGGPVLDQKGNVVGVVVSKLDALTVASAIKDVPQNVNFAIKSAIAQNFLDTNNISTGVQINDAVLDAAAVADMARFFTVRIDCK